MAVLLGLYWIVHGVVELAATIDGEERPARGPTGAGGIQEIVPGAVLAFLSDPRCQLGRPIGGGCGGLMGGHALIRRPGEVLFR
jgi:hypothetical protein